MVCVLTEFSFTLPCNKPPVVLPSSASIAAMPLTSMAKFSIVAKITSSS